MGELRESMSVDLSGITSSLSAADARLQKLERVVARVQARSKQITGEAEQRISTVDRRLASLGKRLGKTGFKFGLGFAAVELAGGIESKTVGSFIDIGAAAFFGGPGLAAGVAVSKIVIELLGTLRAAQREIAELKKARIELERKFAENRIKFDRELRAIRFEALRKFGEIHREEKELGEELFYQTAIVLGGR